MKQKNGSWQNRAFIFAFFVLMLLCWCPVGYGTYGPAGRLFGMPYWAVVAFTLAGALFVLEWIYLFHTAMAMNDEELPDILSQLETLDADHSVPAAEDE